MSVQFDFAFDTDLHDAARAFAEHSCQSPLPEGNYTGMLARAYLDLVEWRGLPEPLKCYPSIQLISGGFFDFLDPDASPIFPEDIAHALSKIARYNGHTVGDLSYSVAQHCVLASRNAPDGFKFEALMHDAPEYVTGDMTTPLKQLLPDFKRIEERVEHAIARRFGLPRGMSAEVKLVDIRMAATEKRDLMPPGEDWAYLEGVEPYEDLIEVWPSAVARVGWLVAFEQLWHEHHKAAA